MMMPNGLGLVSAARRLLKSSRSTDSSSSSSSSAASSPARSSVETDVVMLSVNGAARSVGVCFCCERVWKREKGRQKDTDRMLMLNFPFLSKCILLSKIFLFLQWWQRKNCRSCRLKRFAEFEGNSVWCNVHNRKFFQSHHLVW